MFSFKCCFLLVYLVVLFLYFLGLPVIINRFEVGAGSLVEFALGVAFGGVFDATVCLLVLIVPLLLTLFLGFLFPI